MMKKISKTHENDSDDEDRNPKLLFMMKEPPTLEEIISDLKLKQKKKEEIEMWENRRTKSKKDPLLDISCKLSTLLKEPFNKDEAWIPYGNYYKIANNYFSKVEIEELEKKYEQLNE